MDSRKVSNSYSVFVGAIALIVTILLFIFALGNAFNLSVSDGGFFVYIQNIAAKFGNVVINIGGPIFYFIWTFILYFYRVFLLVSVAMFINRKLKKRIVERVFRDTDKEHREEYLRFNPKDYCTLGEHCIYLSTYILLFTGIVVAFNIFHKTPDTYSIVNNASTLGEYLLLSLAPVFGCALNIIMIILGFLSCKFYNRKYYREELCGHTF